MNYKYMKKALKLAKKAVGFTNPNPLVGAVIVKDDKIIGKGYHKTYGKNHAEVNAIEDAKKNLNKLEGSTMYVTLEPCSHYGNTPPCVDAIIKNNIKKVIVGMKDPNPLVAGKGIKKLKENNIEVKVGVLEKTCKRLNEVFINYIKDDTPFVNLKAAMTLDGKIASKTNDSKWISSEKSREYVHYLRQKYSAILVGINTVISDNPRLTTRLDQDKVSNPIRIILDTKCRIPLDSKVLQVNKNKKTILITSKLADDNKINKIENMGVTVKKLPLKDKHINIVKVIKYLSKKEIDSILVEGGSEIYYSFLENNLVDKLTLFISPKIIGGREAVPFVTGKGKEKISQGFELKDFQVSKISNDLLIESYLKKDDD